MTQPDSCTDCASGQHHSFDEECKLSYRAWVRNGLYRLDAEQVYQLFFSRLKEAKLSLEDAFKVIGPLEPIAKLNEDRYFRDLLYDIHIESQGTVSYSTI